MVRALSMLFVLVGWSVAGCGPEPRAAPPSRYPGLEAVAPAANGDGLTRVLVFYDMEGVAGQDTWRSFLFGMPEYPHGRELLTADLNAVIAGLFDAGADSVDVVDAHGSTNSAEPDALESALDRRARIVYRDHPFDPMLDLAEPGRYDAIAGVAHHARTGSRGFASHTITIGMEVLIDDRPVTEVELFAYSMGEQGVPLIFVSGDDRLEQNLNDAGIDWIQYVVTKRSLSADRVELRPVDEVHAEMRTKARIALEQRDAAKALRLGDPIKTTLHAVPPASLALLDGVPGIDYRDQRVTFEAPNFRAALTGLERLINVAQSGYQEEMTGAWMRGRDPNDEMRAGMVAIITRWLDVESGRDSTAAGRPMLDRFAPDSGHRYHGAN
jgi:D-amino peptidase